MTKTSLNSVSYELSRKLLSVHRLRCSFCRLSLDVDIGPIDENASGRKLMHSSNVAFDIRKFFFVQIKNADGSKTFDRFALELPALELRLASMFGILRLVVTSRALACLCGP